MLDRKETLVSLHLFFVKKFFPLLFKFYTLLIKINYNNPIEGEFGKLKKILGRFGGYCSLYLYIMGRGCDY